MEYVRVHYCHREREREREREGEREREERKEEEKKTDREREREGYKKRGFFEEHLTTFESLEPKSVLPSSKY